MKYPFSIIVFFVGLSMFVFSSCDDDEGLSSYADITINGYEYALTHDNSIAGSWDRNTYDGFFTITVFDKENAPQSCLYFTFIFNTWYNPEKWVQPALNYDFSERFLGLNLSAGTSNPPQFLYESGSAIVIGANQTSDQLTVKFDNLVMSNGKQSYMFDGIIVTDFIYDHEPYY